MSYTYGMYRLEETRREDILARLRARIKREVAPPAMADGPPPDIATPERLFFAVEDSARLSAVLPSVESLAKAGHQVVIAVPETLAIPAGEAWDYLSREIKDRVRILPLPSIQ